MAVIGFDHMHLRSPDPEATAQYYERMFGAEVLRKMQNGKPRVDIRLAGMNIFIAPIAPEDAVAEAPNSPYAGLDHFGLSVSGIDALAADLKAKGAEFSMEPTSPRPGIKIAFIRGPQNVTIELVDRSVA